MKIAGVKAGNERGRITVLFEDGSEMKVSAVEVADFSLYSGRELSPDEYGRLRGDLELRSSKARAMRILGNRSLSAREVERRLKNKGDSAETAQNTVAWLESIGAVNDAEYTASIVRHYYSKGYGPARIKDELYRRGIPRELWEEALGGGETGRPAVYEFLEKRLRDSRDQADLRRAAEALCRRGFSYEEAREAVREYLESCEEADG